MIDKRILAVVFRSVLLACLVLMLSAAVALAAGTEVKLYSAGDPTGYVGVTLDYVHVASGYQYTYVVTNHSGIADYKLSKFLYTCLGISDPNTAFLPLGNPTWIAPSGWGSVIYQYADRRPWVIKLLEHGVPAVELMWDASGVMNPNDPHYSAPVGVGSSASFGFTSPFAIRGMDPTDIGTAYVGGAYSNGRDMLYGPYDPGTSPGRTQVPEWPSVLLGLMGFGGMARRFRRRPETSR